jgi:ribosome-binding factor A
MDSAKIKKKERLISLLAEIAGSFVRFEVDPKAMVTVTRTELSDDSRTAKFLISVFPKNKEREILASLNKKNALFKSYLMAKTRMKFLPSAFFELDRSWEVELKIDKIKI